MIEAALYIALGALSISLLLFAVLPIVSARARRLAINELERQAPVSLSEITAQKDQMRAKFAVDMNRQEKRVSKLQSETHQYRIDAERWRGHAQSVEMDFDKLTEDVAKSQKKFTRMETELAKQKEIAKSALKTPTGKDTQARLTLENEVDELRAEKSVGHAKIVSLQTELSNAQSRIAEMERMMPSLEELDLRKELKILAQDVAKHVKNSPPTPALPKVQKAEIEKVEKAAAPQVTPAPVQIPQMVLKSQQAPSKALATGVKPMTEAQTPAPRPAPTAEPGNPSIGATAPTASNAAPKIVINGVNGAAAATSQAASIIVPSVENHPSKPDVSEDVNRADDKQMETQPPADDSIEAILAIEKPVEDDVKISSGEISHSQGNGSTINGNSPALYSGAKAPLKQPAKLDSKSSGKSAGKSNGTTPHFGAVGKHVKAAKKGGADNRKKTTDLSERIRSLKSEVASS